MRKAGCRWHRTPSLGRLPHGKIASPASRLPVGGHVYYMKLTHHSPHSSSREGSRLLPKWSVIEGRQRDGSGRASDCGKPPSDACGAVTGSSSPRKDIKNLLGASGCSCRNWTRGHSSRKLLTFRWNSRAWIRLSFLEPLNH